MKKFSKRIRSPSSPGLIPQQFKDITQSSGTNSHSTFHLLPQVSSFRDSRHHSSGTTMTPKTNRSSITDDSSNSLDPFNTADSNNQDPQNIGLDLIQKKQQDNLNNFKGHSAVQLSEADQLQNSDQSASANVSNSNPYFQHQGFPPHYKIHTLPQQIRTEGVKIEEFDLSENPYDFINSTDDFQVKLKHDYSVNNSTTDLYKSAEEANHKRVSGNHDGSSDLGNEGDMVNEKALPSTPSTNNNTSEINSTAATGTNGNGTPSSTRRLSRTGAFGSQVNSATASITGNIHRTLRRVASAPLGLKSLTEGSDSNDFSSQPVIQESSDNDPKSAINSNGLLTSDKSSNGSSKTDDLKSHIGEISVRHRSSSKPTGRNYAAIG
ncbi:unnamed protein product [[Candida] boidinii]|nr:unnamed protein product [[Candida] boidinii]